MIRSHIEAPNARAAAAAIHGNASVPAERFMRLPEVSATCGLPTSSIYDGVRRGDFPKPVPLTGKSVAWLGSEIYEWMASRIAARQT
ncbi:helix-turn-helix transcriptional regulator [Ralstonia solanacearum]|uniref:helix-turn-helix transcriptional regulator n=1 Tax=Ralstonia solanacearum TaxID=305 RepID=UPI00230545CD|nr:AlpA family transcriptional regulator [Ralstonia solanacearum]MDB0564810.1 AlpA family transcriptional regulator [Ralstonia solanacearum]MDB0575499.1 AlpA family transcriptional regulator [Ralstonia solanacearum]